MRIILAAVILAVLAGSASAQQTHVPRYGEKEEEKSAQEKAAEKAAERAYQKSLNNIPDKGPVDPWGAVRTTDSPTQTTAKPKKTKTGSTDTKQ